MNAKTMKVIIAVLALLLVAGVSAYAATNYGTRDDPLITKSYLDEVVKPQMETELQTQLDAAAAAIRKSTPGEFAMLELRAGQSLRCGAGCQMLPVSGSVKALGALTDTTAGEALSSGGALSLNHLYMATEDGGVTAAGAATILVSGSYTLD